MATRSLLAERVAAYRAEHGIDVDMLSIGGVDAARRVAQGEPFDVVVLAAEAIDRLLAAGHVAERLDWVKSGVAAAVPRGAPRPDLSSGEAVRRAVLQAGRIGYSTGPSGVALSALFERWGVRERLGDRLVQAPAGVPVGVLVERGEVDLGFQQLSELLEVEGIDLLGPLPDDIQIVTTFTAAVCRSAQDAPAAAAFLAWLAAPAAAAAIQRHGMTPA